MIACWLLTALIHEREGERGEGGMREGLDSGDIMLIHPRRQRKVRTRGAWLFIYFNSYISTLKILHNYVKFASSREHDLILENWNHNVHYALECPLCLGIGIFNYLFNSIFHQSYFCEALKYDIFFKICVVPSQSKPCRQKSKL